MIYMLWILILISTTLLMIFYAKYLNAKDDLTKKEIASYASKYNAIENGQIVSFSTGYNFDVYSRIKILLGFPMRLSLFWTKEHPVKIMLGTEDKEDKITVTFQ